MPIHPSAIIDPSAEIDESCDIGPFSKIGKNCKLGANNQVLQGAQLGENTIVGEENIFHPYSMVGQDPQYLGFDPSTNSGTIIGNKNQFREFCTVHRGAKSGESTVFGNENFLMSYTHVAHDCQFGDHIVMVNFSGLAGHIIVEDSVFISGYAAMHQFCRIGTLAMIGGYAKLPKDAPPYMTMKHYGVVIGVNAVGMRRAGIGPQARSAIKVAYKELFRSKRPLKDSIALLREEWAGKEMPEELNHLLTFCETSKRGMSRGPRNNMEANSDEMGDGDE
jgi:UDP-N-acetylglucosamine acyltransferase